MLDIVSSLSHYNIFKKGADISDGPVSGPEPETDRPAPILKGPIPTKDRIKTDLMMIRFPVTNRRPTPILKGPKPTKTGPSLADIMHL